MNSTNDTTLQAHEIAQIFPLIQGKEFDDLCDDIEKYGLREPIWLYEGKILDGRNRAEACSITGAELLTREYEGDEPLEFVLSLNLHRRHLNESQRGMVAASISNLAHGGDRKSDQDTNLRLDSVSRSEAAEKLNVSKGTVNSAKKVQNEGVPELVEKVNEGVLPVSTAAFVAGLEEDDQREIATSENPKRAAAEKKAVHVSQNSGNDEWYTPSKYIECARNAMGTIDVDPASCEIANRTVNATKYFTIDDDGLTQKWLGNVWMNPPYSGKLIGPFVETILEKYASHEVTQACVLVNNATETKWGQSLLLAASSACFISKRIKYLDETGTAKNTGLQGQMVCYLGTNPQSFRNAFEDVGVVLNG